jgi:hypothetical protein
MLRDEGRLWPHGFSTQGLSLRACVFVIKPQIPHNTWSAKMIFKISGTYFEAITQDTHPSI